MIIFSSFSLQPWIQPPLSFLMHMKKTPVCFTCHQCLPPNSISGQSSYNLHLPLSLFREAQPHKLCTLLHILSKGIFYFLPLYCAEKPKILVPWLGLAVLVASSGHLWFWDPCVWATLLSSRTCLFDVASLYPTPIHIIPHRWGTSQIRVSYQFLSLSVSEINEVTSENLLCIPWTGVTTLNFLEQVYYLKPLGRVIALSSFGNPSVYAWWQPMRTDLGAFSLSHSQNKWQFLLESVIQSTLAVAPGSPPVWSPCKWPNFSHPSKDTPHS